MLDGLFFNQKHAESEGTHLSFFWFCLAFILVGLDWLVKYLATLFFTDNQSDNLFGIELFRNYYFAFSIHLSSFVMFAIYAVVLLLAFIYSYWNWGLFSGMTRLGWVLVFSGGVANVLERSVFGYVIDFIKIRTGFFNFADLYIIFGIMLLMFFSSPRFVSKREN